MAWQSMLYLVGQGLVHQLVVAKQQMIGMAVLGRSAVPHHFEPVIHHSLFPLFTLLRPASSDAMITIKMFSKYIFKKSIISIQTCTHSTHSTHCDSGI